MSESESLSDSDILAIFKENGLPDVGVYTYDELATIQNLDDICLPYCIILIRTAPNYGHYIALLRLKDDSGYEYFDPYGTFIDKSLSEVSEKIRSTLDENEPYISNLFIQKDFGGHDIFFNQYKFQKESKKVNTCGKHCVLRCIYDHKHGKNKDLKDYYKMLKKYGGDFDKTVTRLYEELKGN
jgi:hypothetical protein